VGNTSGNLTIKSTGATDKTFPLSGTVSKANQTISFGTLANKTFGDAPFTLNATSSSGLAMTYTSSNTNVATISGNTVTIVGAGTTNIIASQAGNTNYNEATSAVQALTVTKANQSISFGTLANKTYGDAPFNLSGTSSSGLGLTYTSSNTAVATIVGNTVTIVGAGTATITASQPGNGNYNAATAVPRTLTVNKANQTITFNTLAAKTYGDAPFNLSGTSSSGLGLTYTSSNTAVATIIGNTVTIVGAGTATITASQSGNGNYNAANSVPRSLTVNKANQTITFNTLAAKTFGDAPFNLSGTSSSGLGLTYTSSNTAVATIVGNTATIVGAGTATITASQPGNGNYNAANSVPRSLTVNKANQSITFATLTDKTYGDSPFTLNATSSSGLAITYTSSNTNVAIINGNTITIVGAGNTNITANQAGNINYDPTSFSRSLVVNKASQTITLEPLTDVYTNTSPFIINAQASSGLPLTYTIISGPATINDNIVTLDGIIGLVEIEIGQDGNANYEAAETISGSFNVQLATKINKSIHSQKLTFYPNPAKGSTTLYMPTSNDTYVISIYNTTGEKVYEESIQGENKSIDTSAMTSGIYYLTLTNARGEHFDGKLLVTE